MTIAISQNVTVAIRNASRTDNALLFFEISPKMMKFLLEQLANWLPCLVGEVYNLFSDYSENLIKPIR